jgi:anti-sigma factor RsiW
MGRPCDKHIDDQELDALVPSSSEQGEGEYGPAPASIREAEHHLASCAECRGKVSQYRQVLNRSLIVGATDARTPQPGCPTAIDWDEVASGLWPELRTRQLIAHAARCAYCGPLLHTAATTDEEPTAQEEELLARLKAPSRPAVTAMRKAIAANNPLSRWRQFLAAKTLVPAGALLVLVAVLSIGRPASSTLSGLELAQFAANIHKQHLQGKLALDIQTGSQTQLNDWLHKEFQFALALPPSSEALSDLPYQIKGARLVEIHSKAAAYISYQMQADPVSLVVTPVSVAVASGGVEAAFKNVSFHYYTIHGYKVVTWSVHGLTYALVSQEGNKTQRSCMVCHSAMRDRDLSRTPTPMSDEKSVAEPIWQ